MLPLVVEQLWARRMTWVGDIPPTNRGDTVLDRPTARKRSGEDRIDELETPDEVEHIARDSYGMVLPGEEAFRILPPAVAPVALPETWPFTGASDWLNR